MTWQHPPIKKMADVESGFGFPKQYQGVLDAEYPFYKVGDMNLPGNESEMRVSSNTISKEVLKALQAKVFPPGTVIFPKIGAAIATNKKRILTKPSIVDNNVMGLIPKEGIESRFLFYWMQQFDLRSVANSGPVPSMRKSEMEEVKIPLPTPSEQRRIVEILDQADALRKRRAEAEIKVARILPTLFYQMFGDPATNSKGWPKVPLGQLSLGRPQYGANAKAVEYQEGMPRYIRITDINEFGQLNQRSLKTLDLSDWQHYRLAEGDLLFARSGATVGKSYLYCKQDGVCAFAGYLIRFQIDRDKMNPWVAFAYTQTPHYKNWVATKQRAAAQPNINGQEYASLTLMRPDLNIQQKFANRMMRVLEIRRDLTTRSMIVEDLYRLLLHRAFSGKLTAKWRQVHTNELLQEIQYQMRALVHQGQQ